MHLTIPVGLNAAPFRGAVQRPIDIQGISMRSLSGFRSIRCRRTWKREPLGTLTSLRLDREGRSYGRAAFVPLFDLLPRGQIRVFHLFLLLSTSRHLLLLFHEFNRLHLLPPNLIHTHNHNHNHNHTHTHTHSLSLNQNSPLRGEGRQWV